MKNKTYPRQDVISILLVMFLVMMAGELVAIPFTYLLELGFKESGVVPHFDLEPLTLLFSTIFQMGAIILYARFHELHDFKTIGFVKKKALGSYVKGYFIGILMISSVVFLAIISGSVNIIYNIKPVSFIVIALFFFAYMIQGANEEVILRGYLTPQLCRVTTLRNTIIVSSLVFAAMHLGNEGISPLAFLNLFLYGIFMSLYFISTKNIWGVAAIHGAWNFFEGNIFGSAVSGNFKTSSLIHLENNPALSWLNGGTFGLEGGLIVSLILVISIFIVIKLNPIKAMMIEK